MDPAACKKISDGNQVKFPEFSVNRLLSKYCEFEIYQENRLTLYGEKRRGAIPKTIKFNEIFDEKPSLTLTEFLLVPALEVHLHLANDNLHRAIK